jgi:hypothetical protein
MICKSVICESATVNRAKSSANQVTSPGLRGSIPTTTGTYAVSTPSQCLTTCQETASSDPRRQPGSAFERCSAEPKGIS